MARPIKFRWTKDYAQELKRAVTRFNNQLELAKVKLGPDLEFILPGKADYEEIKARINTRQEFRQELARLGRVDLKSLSPVQMGNRIITEYEQSEIKRAERLANRNAELLLNDVQRVAKQEGRFPSETSILLNKLAMQTGADPREYKKLLDQLSKRPEYNESNQRWRENYLKALDSQYQYLITKNINDPEVLEALRLNHEIYKRVASMEMKSFLIGSLVFDTELAIEFIYPQYMVSARNERILNLWERVAGTVS